MATQISFSSLVFGIGGSSGCSGHSEHGSFSHSGPFHQREFPSSSEGNKPLEAQSAGFCVPLTCLQCLVGINSIIQEIRLPTYVLNRRELPSNQFMTMVLSVHA